MGGIVGYDPHAYSRRTPRGDDSGSGSGNSGPRQGQAGPAGAAGLLEKLRRTANRRGNPAATPYTPASPAPAGTANRANYDPYLKRHAERVEDRLDNFGASTGRAIDQAVGKVRDLGFGQKKAGQQAAAASGLLGTSSIPQFQGRQIDAAVMQQGAGVAADVALGRERDYDSLLLGSTGALGAPGEAARADRAGARADEAADLNRWAVMQQEKRAAEQSQLAQWLAEMQLALSL